MHIFPWQVFNGLSYLPCFKVNLDLSPCLWSRLWACLTHPPSLGLREGKVSSARRAGRDVAQRL